MDRPPSSLKVLLKRIESGDHTAERAVWNQFFEELLRYVEAKVRHRGVPRGLLDEEAVAASVLESVFKCAKAGRLSSVENWSELSKLLYAMTNRKFVDHWRRATAQRAYPGKVLQSLQPELANISDHEVASYSIEFEEELSRLMGLLPDEVHRQIAVLKLAEHSVEEVSHEVGCAVPTVNRKWRNIRRIWAAELLRQEQSDV